MAEQSFQSHAHRPTHTGVAWIFAVAALALLWRESAWQNRDWAALFVILSVIMLGWISRV